MFTPEGDGDRGRGHGGRDYLVGDGFTIADAYLVWWLTLASRVGIDTATHTGIEACRSRCAARAGVQAALGYEPAQAAQ